ncbi:MULTISPECIES: hypothetical protein [unclassified Streptomyces]|uniref:hypothetical protein n=1 Tax=unclassified Streptomyces TaxID=2593676 RepID=UPI001BE90B93|nr:MULTISPECIES: hypothetical protein [unclassified Streptomyces]MBT2407606.1 hypothetical protein [Streptomyces sp. ISL-21]MBT2459086.1 hypothetical protein [Streptomyces sp. ISL-86]MBT2611600.1 hypothetical protein [Streptomyces sp. ISL-87]
MSTSPKSHVPHGEGPSRHEGTEQHGWSPDVEATNKQDNPSARRSFHPEEQSANPKRTRKAPGSSKKADEGVPVKSSSRRGEQQSKGSGQKGHHDLGTRGASQRPSGGKDASAFTGVNPESEPKKMRRG